MKVFIFHGIPASQCSRKCCFTSVSTLALLGADLRGPQRCPRGPNSFIFMQFSHRPLKRHFESQLNKKPVSFQPKKLVSIPTLWVGAPLRKILDPPLLTALDMFINVIMQYYFFRYMFRLFVHDSKCNFSLTVLVKSRSELSDRLDVPSRYSIPLPNSD